MKHFRKNVFCVVNSIGAVFLFVGAVSGTKRDFDPLF
jgi:hypothetical protein